MNPILLECLSFAGRRAAGAIISCAALMLFKASVDAVQRKRNHDKFFTQKQVIDPETGEFLYASIQ